MKLLGLTGGVGMGKSTVAQMLRDEGCAIVDTDELARQVVEPGQPALTTIREAFGSGVLDPSGRLRREVLAARVFADAAARQRLEAIIHPRVRDLWRRQADQWRAAGRAVGVVVIPLLFETGADNELDATVCVACTPRTQAERLAARGWTPAAARDRIRAQWPTEQKLARSSHVIWTEGDLDVAAAQVRRLLRQMNLLGLN